MTDILLITNELVMIKAYYSKGRKMSAIVASLGRLKQTIDNVIHFLKGGHSVYGNYDRYKFEKSVVVILKHS